MLLRAKADNMF